MDTVTGLDPRNRPKDESSTENPSLKNGCVKTTLEVPGELTDEEARGRVREEGKGEVFTHRIGNRSHSEALEIAAREVMCSQDTERQEALLLTYKSLAAGSVEILFSQWSQL